MAVIILPPWGIAGIPASFYPIGFSRSLVPGDIVHLGLEYSRARSPDGPEDVWTGTARSGTIILTAGERDAK